MSTRLRFSRKSLKKPDEFLTVTGKVLRYFEENRNVAIAIAFGVAILIAAVGGVRLNKQSQEARMESLISEMKHVLDARKDKKPDQVTAELEHVLEKFGEGSQKHRASLLLADFNFQSQNYDKAIKSYSDIFAKTSDTELSHDLAQLGLAYSLEAKKEYKKAIESYKAIIDRKTFSLPLFPVYLDLSRCYELDNDKKNALLILREMIHKFQRNAELDKINRQINILEGKS